MQPLTASRNHRAEPALRRSPAPLRRDPAPSRAAYRMQRLWLTPLFRALFRVGLPAFVSVFAVGLFLSDAARRDALVARFSDLRQSVEDRPEFRVTEIAFSGVNDDVARALRMMMPISFPVSSFDLDLEAMRATLEGLDAVARADLRVAPGGVLNVTIEQRQPALVWRGRAGLEVVDAEGHRVAGISARDDRADLPLIVGDGAKTAAPEALALLAAAAPVADRLRGLVRIGERRWDVVLDREQRILLPETGALGALQRVVALHLAQDLLNRAIVSVDMRTPNRPTLRRLPEPVVPDPLLVNAGDPGAAADTPAGQTEPTPPTAGDVP